MISLLKKLLGKHFELFRQMFLYGVIGLIAAAADSLLFVGLTHINLNQYLANFISVNLGILVSFLFNSHFNFKMTTSMGQRALKFFCVGYLGLGLSTVILYLGTSLLGQNATVVKLISIIIVAAFQFVLNKLVTFRDKG